MRTVPRAFCTVSLCCKFLLKIREKCFPLEKFFDVSRQRKCFGAKNEKSEIVNSVST